MEPRDIYDFEDKANNNCGDGSSSDNGFDHKWLSPHRTAPTPTPKHTPTSTPTPTPKHTPTPIPIPTLTPAPTPPGAQNDQNSPVCSLCGARGICPKVPRVEKTLTTKHRKLIAQEMLCKKHYKYNTRIPYKTIIRIEGGKNICLCFIYIW